MPKISETLPYLVECALTRIESGETVESACSWVWFRHSTNHERCAMDTWIVETGHRLGQEAGSAYQRFVTLVREAMITQGVEEETR